MEDVSLDVAQFLTGDDQTGVQQYSQGMVDADLGVAFTGAAAPEPVAPVPAPVATPPSNGYVPQKKFDDTLVVPAVSKEPVTAMSVFGEGYEDLEASINELFDDMKKQSDTKKQEADIQKEVPKAEVKNELDNKDQKNNMRLIIEEKFNALQEEKYVIQDENKRLKYELSQADARAKEAIDKYEQSQNNIRNLSNVPESLRDATYYYQEYAKDTTNKMNQIKTVTVITNLLESITGKDLGGYLASFNGSPSQPSYGSRGVSSIPHIRPAKPEPGIESRVADVF